MIRIDKSSWLHPANLLPVLIILIFSLAALRLTITISEHGNIEDMRTTITGLVWALGISGYVLIILLVNKILKLQEADQERRRLMDVMRSQMAAVESAFDGIIIVGPDGRISYMNRSALSFFMCHDPKVLIGAEWTRLYDKAQQERFFEEVRPVLERDGAWHGRSVGHRMDGNTFQQDVSLARMSSGEFILIFRDVTKQLADEAVSSQRLAAIEAASDGIGIVDPAGQLIYMNRSLMNLHGIPDEYKWLYIGKSWEELYNEDGKREIREDVLPELARRGTWRGETPLYRRDGTLVYTEMSLTRLPGGGMIGTARDISERRQADEEKEILQQQYFQAQKMEAVGRLAGGLAHDFNNILASILGNAEFLTEDLETATPQHKFARGIVTAAEQAQKLVDQMMTFSRRSGGERSLVNISNALDEFIPMVEASVPKSIELRLDVEPGQLAVINANVTNLSQAMLNLAVNAVDAMEAGGVLTIGFSVLEPDEDLYVQGFLDGLPSETENPPVCIVELESGHNILEMGNFRRNQVYACLSVEDSGTGMPAEVLGHIFEPFFTTKDLHKGTGLGMSTVHGIVTSHQGVLIVDTVIGKGTRFEVYLPVASEADEERELRKASEKKFDPLSGSVMVIDDQQEVADVMATSLSRFGLKVKTFSHAQGALDDLRGGLTHYDLLLSDFNMPGMNGLEFCRALQDFMPDMPVVMVSGDSYDNVKARVAEYPCIRHVMSKPLNKSELYAQVRKILDEKRAA